MQANEMRWGWGITLCYDNSMKNIFFYLIWYENSFCLFPSLRFYFDPSSGTCRQFYYGGCEGNKNNFKTLGECEAR